MVIVVIVVAVLVIVVVVMTVMTEHSQRIHVAPHSLLLIRCYMVYLMQWPQIN